MQRRDLQPYERIPLLHDLDDAERGMVIADNNKKTLLMRLEECIYALSMQDELHNNNKKYHNAALNFHCAATILALMTPVMIEAIILLITLSTPNTGFITKYEQSDYNADNAYCPNIYTQPTCFYPRCGENYPIKNFNDPWPYAHPMGNTNSILDACHSMYQNIISDATFSRIAIIIVASFANLTIGILLLIVMSFTIPQRQRLLSDSTTLAMLPKKIQDEINDLAIKTSTVITDFHNINEIIRALRPALEERQRVQQRRAFLSGSLDKNKETPLYRFFHGQTVNDKHVRGDGDMATTERIFQYAGLLK